MKKAMRLTIIEEGKPRAFGETPSMRKTERKNGLA
jgi:hypothetical protein